MRKSFGRFALVLLLSGVGFAATACAQPTYGYGGYGQRGGVYGRSYQRRAFDEGYRRGFDRGQDDVRRNRRESLDRIKDYRNADRGYRRTDGPRDAYRATFRQGFRNGYNDAFRQYSVYDRYDPRYDPRGPRR